MDNSSSISSRLSLSSSPRAPIDYELLAVHSKKCAQACGIMISIQGCGGSMRGLPPIITTSVPNLLTGIQLKALSEQTMRRWQSGQRHRRFSITSSLSMPAPQCSHLNHSMRSDYDNVLLTPRLPASIQRNIRRPMYKAVGSMLVAPYQEYALN